MLIHTFGDPDEYFTEMIHAPSLLAGGPFEQWYLRANPAPEKLVWQLTSPKAEAFAQAIPVVLQHGGIGVDLNMGCSAPPIVRTGAGVAWMLKPLNTTAEAVRSVKQALEAYSTEQGKPFRLSVKLRLGATIDYAYLLRFCTMLIDEGVQLITIHPRLQRQSYARPALHEYTAALRTTHRTVSTLNKRPYRFCNTSKPNSLLSSSLRGRSGSFSFIATTFRLPTIAGHSYCVLEAGKKWSTRYIPILNSRRAIN